MRISHQVLQRFCAGTPSEPKALRKLLDDVGIEVKRLEAQAHDALLTLELLASRGDHHCYAGIAREVGARTKTAVSLPPTLRLSRGEPAVPLSVDSDKCLLYSVSLFQVTGALSSSLGADADQLLGATGLHLGNAVVGATNAVNLEFGQPLHAFDRERIDGGITVRLSRPGEKAWLLFSSGPREIPSGTLVIADQKKVLAIAGVIGCEESKVRDDTREFLLESAAFDPVTVRMGARSLAIRTDASARFERGSDPTLVALAAGRVAYLLQHANVAKATAPLGSVGVWQDPKRVIRLNKGELEHFLSRSFEDAEVVERLAAYGFAHVGGFEFLVPPARLWDVEFEEDLFEELARSVGFNELSQSLPLVSLGALPSQREVTLHAAEEVLISAGFYEVYSDGFYSREVPEQLLQVEGSPLCRHVETVNSLDSSFSLLKNNCLAQALQAVADNLNVKAQDVSLYEWTRTFHPDAKAANGVCSERDILWGVCSGNERPGSWDGLGRPVDVFFLKGLFHELRRELNLPLDFDDPDPDYPLSGLMHPHRSLSLKLCGVTVGVLGEVLPQVLRNFGIKFARACYFELTCDALLAPPLDGAAFDFPPAMPAIERMLSFTVPSGIKSREIIPLLHAASPAWLESAQVADVFLGKAEGLERAITFRLLFRATEGRTHEQLNEACAAMVEGVVQALGARGVELR